MLTFDWIWDADAPSTPTDAALHGIGKGGGTQETNANSSSPMFHRPSWSCDDPWRNQAATAPATTWPAAPTWNTTSGKRENCAYRPKHKRHPYPSPSYLNSLTVLGIFWGYLSCDFSQFKPKSHT